MEKSKRLLPANTVGVCGECEMCRVYASTYTSVKGEGERQVESRNGRNLQLNRSKDLEGLEKKSGS